MTREIWAGFVIAITISLLIAAVFVGILATTHSSARQRPALCATTAKEYV